MRYQIINESDMVQGSPQWHAFRAGGIGGSEIASVMNRNPYQTAYQLWQIKSGAKQAPDLSDNYAIKRGHALEPMARAIVNERLAANFQPCIFQSLEHSFLKYSSDGFDSARNELIEIKALGEKNHLIVKETQAPLSYYMDQCQWSLMITGCSKIHFVSYCQSFPEPIVMIEVLPDPKWQAEQLAAAIKFWKLVETKTPPELSDADFLDISCETFGKITAEFILKSSQLKQLESELELLKDQIKKIAAGRNIIGNGIKAYTSARKGAVDYAKIPELAGVDLEKYRKPDSEIVYIKAYSGK